MSADQQQTHHAHADESLEVKGMESIMEESIHGFIDKPSENLQREEGKGSSRGESDSGYIGCLPDHRTQPDTVPEKAGDYCHPPNKSQPCAQEKQGSCLVSIERPSYQPDESDNTVTAKACPLCKSVVPSVTVNVIPAIDDNETIQGAMSKGFAALTRATSAANSLYNLAAQIGDFNNEQRYLADDLGNVVTNFVKINSQISPTAKPRRICAYHIYGTKRMIASFLDVKSALHRVWPTLQIHKRNEILRGIFTS